MMLSDTVSEYLRSVSTFFRQPENSERLRRSLIAVYSVHGKPNPVWETIFNGLLRLDETAKDKELQRMVFVLGYRRLNQMSPRADFTFRDEMGIVEMLILDGMKNQETGESVIADSVSTCVNASRCGVLLVDGVLEALRETDPAQAEHVRKTIKLDLLVFADVITASIEWTEENLQIWQKMQKMFSPEIRAQFEDRPKRGRKRSQARPLTQDGAFLLSSSDRITQAVNEALLPHALKRGEALETINRGLENQTLTNSSKQFWAAYPVQSDAKRIGTLQGAVGFRGQPSEAIWNALQKNNALAVKLQFALMARAYAEANFKAGEFVTVDINQICDDMGYVRKKGSHRRENKEAVKELLEVVTSTEIALIFQAPGKDGKTKWHKLEGPYWARGVMHSESDRYNDLFHWTPETFTYSPGHFFASDDWRTYNSTVAFVGEGILRLSAKDQDKHALLLGAYIALFARINHYKPKAFRVSTLIERVFNQVDAGANRNTARLIDTLEKSLDRLRAVEVIGSWRYADEADIASTDVDYDDLEAVETRAAMAKEAGKRRNSAGELNRTIAIEWPEKLIQHGLKCRQNKGLNPEN